MRAEHLPKDKMPPSLRTSARHAPSVQQLASMLRAKSRVLRRRAGGEDADEDAADGAEPDEGAGPAEAADSTEEGAEPGPAWERAGPAADARRSSARRGRSPPRARKRSIPPAALTWRVRRAKSARPKDVSLVAVSFPPPRTSPAAAVSCVRQNESDSVGVDFAAAILAQT